MSINVKFGSDPQPVMQDTSIGVKIDRSPSIGVAINNPLLHEIKFKLNIREAHNGDLMIFDHPDIDIIVMIEKMKVVTFAKDLATDIVYGTSSRLMERLRTKGVIAYETIQGGNVYGSLEGQLLEMKNPKFLKQQRKAVFGLMYSALILTVVITINETYSRKLEKVSS